MDTQKMNKRLVAVLPKNIYILRSIVIAWALFWFYVFYVGINLTQYDPSCYAPAMVCN